MVAHLVRDDVRGGKVAGRAELAAQFVEKAEWIERFNVHYHLGVDGISFWFVPLTAFITVIVVIAFERSRLAAAIGSAAHGPKAAAVPEPPVVVPGLDAHEMERELKQKAI